MEVPVGTPGRANRSLDHVPSVTFPQSRAQRATHPTVSRQHRRHTSRDTTRLLVSLWRPTASRGSPRLLRLRSCRRM